LKRRWQSSIRRRRRRRSRLPFGSVGVERDTDAEGARAMWLPAAVVDRLRALRAPGESYSDVILRIARETQVGYRL
jgi:hypothetical protein